MKSSFLDSIRHKVEVAQALSPTIPLDMERELWLGVWRAERNEGKTCWPYARDLTKPELLDRWPVAIACYSYGCKHFSDVIGRPRFVEIYKGMDYNKRCQLHVTAYVPRLDLGGRNARWDEATNLWLRCTRSVKARPHRTYTAKELQ